MSLYFHGYSVIYELKFEDVEIVKIKHKQHDSHVIYNNQNLVLGQFPLGS